MFSYSERNGNKTWEVLDNQLKPLFAAFPKDSPHWHSNIVLAYEPVWAIGTGISSTPEQTLEVFTWLRQRLSKDINESDKVRILYGGSANAKNAGDYMKIKTLDGLLIGGASLKPEFADMVKIGDEANWFFPRPCITFLQLKCIDRLWCSCIKSHNSSGDGLASSPPDLGDVLARERVSLFKFYFIDLIGPHIFLFHCVHQVDLDRVVPTYLNGYVWMVAQPPVWMYSSETPFTSPLSLSLREPGGRMCRAGGDLFSMTTTSPTSFVMILLKPAKS